MEANKNLLRHTIRVAFVQDTNKEVTVKGAKVLRPVKHSVSFKETTTEEINSENLSMYLLGKLFQYQEMQTLQGRRDRFDTTLPVELLIEVDGEVKTCSIKFTTSPANLKRVIERYPRAVARVFDPQSIGFGTTSEQLIKWVEENQVVKIAERINPQEVRNKILADNPLAKLDAEDIPSEEVETKTPENTPAETGEVPA